MSYPTTLGPWFVVQRMRYDPQVIDRIIAIEYYQPSEEGDGLWTLNKNVAALFTSLHQAARVASSETAEVRVLTSKEEAKEFGRS